MFGKKSKSNATSNLKKLEDLYYAAEDARKHAYAPYSDFKVGAALLVRPNEDSVLPINKIYTGVNIENGSYGATLCAERVAFAKAISDGILEYDIGQSPFIAIAVSAGDEEALPCGICRQFMSEFAPDIAIVTKANGEIRMRSLEQLLPESFQLNKEDTVVISTDDSAAEEADAEETAAETAVDEAPAEEADAPVEESAEDAPAEEGADEEAPADEK